MPSNIKYVYVLEYKLLGSTLYWSILAEQNDSLIQVIKIANRQIYEQISPDCEYMTVHSKNKLEEKE